MWSTSFFLLRINFAVWNLCNSIWVFDYYFGTVKYDVGDFIICRFIYMDICVCYIFICLQLLVTQILPFCDLWEYLSSHIQAYTKKHTYTHFLKGGWRDSLVFKSIYCFSRGLEFIYQVLHSTLQLSITPVSNDLTFSSGSSLHAWSNGMVHIHTSRKHFKNLLNIVISSLPYLYEVTIPMSSYPNLQINFMFE